MYLQPDQFISDLQNIPPPRPLEEAAVMRRGYKVKNTLPRLTQEERQQKDDIALRAIGDAMRNKARR